jgi:hypothetical protein
MERGRLSIRADCHGCHRSETYDDDGEVMAEQPEKPEPTDPNDSELLRDKLKGQTTEHADPPRLEDEGQSGG